MKGILSSKESSPAVRWSGVVFPPSFLLETENSAGLVYIVRSGYDIGIKDTKMDFKYSKLQAFHQAKGDVRSFSRRFGDESPDSALARSLASKESKDEDDEIDADTLVDRWQRLFIPRLDETYE